MAEIIHKELSYAIIGAAMEVHRILGPGFLEAVYQAALAHELTLRGIRFEQYKKLPVRYKEILVGDYEADMVVEDQIIPSTSSGQRLELKAVSAFNPAHEAKAHHYLAAIPLRYATGTFGRTAPGYPVEPFDCAQGMLWC